MIEMKFLPSSFPQSLADYLLFLDSNPTELAKYHAWRRQYGVLTQYAGCTAEAASNNGAKAVLSDRTKDAELSDRTKDKHLSLRDKTSASCSMIITTAFCRLCAKLHDAAAMAETKWWTNPHQPDLECDNRMWAFPPYSGPDF